MLKSMRGYSGQIPIMLCGGDEGRSLTRLALNHRLLHRLARLIKPCLTRPAEREIWIDRLKEKSPS